MDADSAYEENTVVVIELNRNGEATNIKTFERKYYDDELRAQIEDKLCLSQHMQLEGTDDPIEKELELKKQAKLTSNSLQYSDEVLVTSSGDLYRIATIVNRNFNDNVAINPLEDNQQKKFDRTVKN